MDTTLKTGTTTIGLVCKDGIVLAADKRVTAGHQILGAVQKIRKVNDRIAITMAGTVSDAVLLTRYLRSELALKELRSRNEVTVRESANLLAQFVFSNIRQMSMIPGVTHFLLAGVDKQGTYLFDIFPDGSVTDVTTFFCSGSGSVYAYGVIDGDYKPTMSVQDGVKLAKKAIRSATIRDNASGNGFDIVSITSAGITEVESVVFEHPIAQQ